MTNRFSQFFFSLILVSFGACAGSVSAQVKVSLKMEGWSHGPFWGQKSVSCLTIYSDGRVTYFHRWNPGTVRIDPKTGKRTLVEQTVSVESHLSHSDLLEVSDFLKSGVVMALEKVFVVPSAGIDFTESTTIHINGTDGNEKRITIREYSTAGLEEKGKLPAALVVLMGKIEEIEKSASLRGKPAKIPCVVPG